MSSLLCDANASMCLLIVTERRGKRHKGEMMMITMRGHVRKFETNVFAITTL